MKHPSDALGKPCGPGLRPLPGLTVLGLTLLGLTLLGAGSAIRAETLRIVGDFPATHSSSVAMTQWKTEVERRSGGALKIDVRSVTQVGGAQESADQVQKGTIFLTWVSTAYLSRTVPELSVLSMPFLFNDRRNAFKVIDGRVGQLLGERLAAKGFLPLGFMELGPRQLTNNQRPIQSMADLKGLYIRLQPDEIHLATFRALGAIPVTMDSKDVYAALQHGILDGQENPFAVIRDRNFNQVQRYLSNTSHFFDFIVLVANKRSFESLKPEHQSLVREAAAQAVAAQRTAAAAEDIGAIVELTQRGMHLTPVSPSFRAEMRKATADIVASVRQKVGKELVDAVLNAEAP